MDSDPVDSALWTRTRLETLGLALELIGLNYITAHNARKHFSYLNTDLTSRSLSVDLSTTCLSRRLQFIANANN